jgi:[ribosomal protein S18]-alanine N-acetyltransferase
MTAPQIAPLTLRYMRPRDVPEVIAIDRASFTPAWPTSSYNFEVNESHCSYMVVLEAQEQQPLSGLRRWLSRMQGWDNPTEVQRMVVGYGGLWKIGEEAHISTIASHPAYRGRGYGEVVLNAMLQRALDLGATYTVLEVRVSNIVAQNLYKKYGFSIAGTKKDYYHNNKEDAYDMRLQLTSEQTHAALKTLYDAIQSKLKFSDDYSFTPHPRLGQ